MTIDLANPDDRASMVSAIADFIISSNDDKSIRQHAEFILDEYITRTNHHIWLVNQCAKILKDVVAKRGLDVDLFMTNCEFHDYDKLHNSEVIPTYAIACHYFYFHNKKVDYKIDEKKVHDEFENIAWPKHHRVNKHHVAEYYGTKNSKGALIVPETNDFLSIIEMYADWMAMGITNGGTAHEWWTKTYGENRKWTFTGADIALIQQCIEAEDAAENQLAYLRQFKDVEPSWAPPTKIETHEDENPIEINKVNEGIENFFNYLSNEDLGLKHEDLFVGAIDPTSIDPVKMMKLAEYPALLLALKKWGHRPNYDLEPELRKFGEIIDKIYQFKNPIMCYRGIRLGFDSRSNKTQNLMGVIDNDITYFRLLKPNFDKPGQTFDYEVPSPLSVARSPYIAKIYGDFIIKTEVSPDTPKLVITPELSYLLQQMEVEYPEYRALNLSTMHEVIVFSGAKLTFEIVSVYGDISNELDTMKEHAFEGLGNTPMNGVYYSIDGVSDEALLSFLNTGLYKTITNIAKPMYKPVGQNSWEHIQQVYSQASRICKKIFNRQLTLVEYAACLFHDCSVIDSGKEQHNLRSAEKAVKALKDIFSEIELDTIYNAILEHDNQVTTGQWKFSSSASEFVAAGDFNPPDAEWIMNKSYTWGITHGLDHTERITNMTALVKRAYSSTGEMWSHMPNVYKKYFATKINAVKKLFDKITPEEAEKIVMAYRKKHHLSDTDINLPTSSVETLVLNNTVQQAIWKEASKYYDKVGSHGLNHIEYVINHAKQLVTLRVENPILTDAEFAACAFHDCALKRYGREKHEETSANLAKPILSKWFDIATVNQIVSAIKEHRASYEGTFTSDMSDLVSSADRNPPNAAYSLYRAYLYGIEHGMDEDAAIERAYVFIPNKYGSKGYCRFPKYYSAYHQKELKAFQHELDTLTIAKAKQLINQCKNDKTLSLEAYSSTEMLKSYGDFANSKEKRIIKDLVNKYYDKTGSHGWNHISEVLATAEKLVKRTLTLVEYTAVVCHDLARKEMDEGHPARSVEIAKEILPGTNLFSTEELKEIYKAIGSHGNKHEFASELCELVACADRCFPKTTIEDLYERPILWMLEGSDKGKPTEKEYDVSDDLSIATRAVSQIKKWCGDIYDKAVKEDNLYTRTFKNDLKKTQDLANNTTPEQVVPVVKKLRSAFKDYSEESISESAEIVKNVPKIVYVATTSKSIGRIVCIDKKHAICAACKRTKDSNILSNYDNSSVSSSSVDISGYDDNKTSGVIRYKVKEITVYEIDTKELHGEFTYEGVEHKHILRYEGDVKDLKSNLKQIDHMTDVSVTIRYSPYEDQSVESMIDQNILTNSSEALSENQIKIVPIEKENEEHLKLIVEGCNLDSKASDDELWSLQDVKDTIKRNDKHFFLLYSGEEIVGMCTISGNALSGFAIFTRYQGKGYGKRSLKAIIKKMRSSNKDKEIILRVAKKNTKAINLYKSCGFEVKKDDDMDEKSFRMILKPDTEILESKSSKKKITFPKEEIETIKKQDRIITTRVSKDYETFQKGDLVETPWYATYKVSDRKEISKIEDHPYYKELTKEQIAFLSKYDKIAVLTLTKISDPESPSTEVITPQVEKNISNGKVYHASPMKFDKLLGSKTGSWSGEQGNVFVTPCKGLCACFIIDKMEVLDKVQEQLGGRLVGVNFGYDVWNWSVDKLKTLPSKVTILLNARGIKPISGESTGYLYTVDYEKYKDKTHMFHKNMESDVEFLIEGDVDFISCEQITVKWECKSSEEEIKRKGEAKVVSNEGLTKVSSNITISKYQGSKEELEIIRQCVNLAAKSVDASDKGYDKATFEKLVNSHKKGPYWTIRNDNDIVGSVSITESTVGADKVYKCSAISDFAILEQYQGKGFGKKALLAIIDYIRKTMKNKDIGLGVAENNTKAISLYKSVGFNVICGANLGEGSKKIIGYQMLLKHEESSNETLAPDIKKKKQLIIDYICSVCDIMDPSKLNSKRYHRLLDSMNDKEFDQWMNYVKEGKWKIHIVAPNLVVTLKNENSLKAADKVKCKLFHRLWMTDDSTGRQYLTDNEYLVLNLPVRRQQQFLDEKMSVPDNDRQIDGMTGQVTGDSKSSAVTNPEIQILAARGLDATLEELVNVRGGNIAAYSDFKRQAEETGEIKLNSLDPNTRSRVAVVGQVLLRSMMIENNIVE